MTYDRDAFARQIKLHEGYKPYAYQDSEGYWTIGYGTLIDRRRGGGLTHEECLMLLNNRVASTEKELDSRLPWWRELDDVRQRIVLDMAYNMGVPTLLTFKNTLAAVQAGDYGRAGANMKLSKWYRQTGTRARRLVKAMQTGAMEE